MINPCPDCGATTKADCKCPDECKSCGFVEAELKPDIEGNLKIKKIIQAK